MNPTRRVQLIAGAVAVLLVGGVAFAVLRGRSDDAERTSGSSDTPGQDSAAGTELQDKPAVWPLTGLRDQGGDGTQPWPAYVVKIDNTESSAPQVGLGKADMVVEELVEGGTTRLAAFFHTQLPTVVGPVRSMRATDIGVVSQAKATIVTSGAASPTIKRINGAGITFLNEGNPNLYRDNGRSAPYNLFANLQAIAKRAAEDHPDPDDYFTWGSAKDLPQGSKASGLDASFGRHTTTWRLEGGRYRNANGYAASDDQLVADTVVVLRVQVGDAGYVDPAGSFVPESKLTGQGSMSIFHDGRRVRGQWSKDDPGSPFVLSTEGKEVPVPAGHTWVEVVPLDGGNVSVD